MWRKFLLEDGEQRVFETQLVALLQRVQEFANKLIGLYVKSIEVENGVMHVTLGNRIESFLRGKVFTVRPYVVPGSPKSPVAWGCGKSPAPEGMKVIGEDRTNTDLVYLPAIHCI